MRGPRGAVDASIAGMRNLGAACVAFVAAGIAFAQDAKKHELVYRWDKLDGKTAIYETEIDATSLVERKTTTAATDEEGTADAGDAKTEVSTSTKQRFSMSFKAGEGGRGL